MNILSMNNCYEIIITQSRGAILRCRAKVLFRIFLSAHSHSANVRENVSRSPFDLIIQRVYDFSSDAHAFSAKNFCRMINYECAIAIARAREEKGDDDLAIDTVAARVRQVRGTARVALNSFACPVLRKRKSPRGREKKIYTYIRRRICGLHSRVWRNAPTNYCSCNPRKYTDHCQIKVRREILRGNYRAITIELTAPTSHNCVPPGAFSTIAGDPAGILRYSVVNRARSL